MKYIVFVKTINNRHLRREFKTADDMKKYITKKYKDGYAITHVHTSADVWGETLGMVHMRSKVYVQRMTMAGYGHKYYNDGFTS